MAVSRLRRWCIDDAELQPKLVTKCFSELLATAMFHLIGSVAGTAAANGAILVVLVYAAAKTSGGHLNPAVSLTFFLLGHIRLGELLLYWVSQICGAAIGALWIAWLVPSLYIRNEIDPYAPTRYDGCFVPDPNLSAVQIFGWEAVGTFCFIVPVMVVVAFSISKTGYGNIGPIIIGISLASTALAVGPFTSASFNPARTLGSPIVFDCPNVDKLVWYVLGELAGAAVVPLVIAPSYGISANAWYLPLLLRLFDLRVEAADDHDAARPPAINIPSPPGDASTSNRASPSPITLLMERRGSITLVPATPGAMAGAEAGVREVRYKCLVPGTNVHAVSRGMRNSLELALSSRQNHGRNNSGSEEHNSSNINITTT